MNEQNQGDTVDVQLEPHGDTALAIRESSLGMMPVIPMEMAVERFKQLTEFVRQIMRSDVDFGVIPGTKKPTLLKPGAEKLCTFFGLRTEFILTDSVKDWEGGFFYFEYKCRLWRGDFVVGEGIGSCNSKEKKYRWRNADRVCPACGQPSIFKGKDPGSGFYCWAKKGGCGAKFPEGDLSIVNQVCGQVENTEPFEIVNTVQKMSQKRAMICATLVAVNASEFFTQDMEDLSGNDQTYEQPAARPAAQQPAVTRASAAPAPSNASVTFNNAGGPSTTERPSGNQAPIGSPLRNAEAAPVQRQAAPAAQPAAAPTKKPEVQLQSEQQAGELVAVGIPSRECAERPTKSGGIRYGIFMGGVWFNSFDVKVKDWANWAHQARKEIRIFHTTSNFGNDVTIIEPVEPIAEESTGVDDSDGNPDLPF